MQEEKNAMSQVRFPQKLWYLLTLQTNSILWGGTGKTILLNYRVLHNYLQCDNSIFKTSNISSFVRQLNLYGFRKVTSHLQDPLCNSSNPYMHEYVHDYFQFGRPELLSKINRKALALKRTPKPKDNFNDHPLCDTPLQKARRTLTLALKKAAQGLYSQSLPAVPKQYFNFECEGVTDTCEEEKQEFAGWITPENSDSDNTKTEQIVPDAAVVEAEVRMDSMDIMVATSSNHHYGDNSLMNMNYDESTQQTDSVSFPTQFMNMPDLDSVPTGNHGVELLAEFNIHYDNDEGITAKLDDKRCRSDGHYSLNCVLPSISNDPIDDVAMAERNSGYSGHYHGEWDLMFNDIMTNKGPNTECSSDLKELYSQISKTIDLLND